MPTERRSAASPAEVVDCGVVQTRNSARLRSHLAPALAFFTMTDGWAKGTERSKFERRGSHRGHHSRTNDFAAFYLWRSADTGIASGMEPSSPVWTAEELDESILTLCDEFPEARMTACSRAVEFCRQSTPRGTSEMLLAAMRGALQREQALSSPRYRTAA